MNRILSEGKTEQNRTEQNKTKKNGKIVSIIYKDLYSNTLLSVIGFDERRDLMENLVSQLISVVDKL